MWKRFHKIARILAVALLVVAILGIGAPYFRADYFASRIQAGLEQSLGRKVKIGAARYNVFRGPGFQVEEVTIGEDPRIGIEPFAHVAEVQARVDVWSLFKGEIRFSNLRMVEPTVNFVRTEQGGPWNVELFLQRTEAAQLPPIQVRDGVVSFKFGDRKSVVYLGNADLDVEPSTAGLRLVAEAEPFRSDMAARAAGRFHFRSTFSGGAIDGELEGERTSIPEIARLLGARDTGLKGFVESSLQLKGPLQAVEVKGQLKLDDLSGGVLLPRWNSVAMPVEGKLNLTVHEIELHTAAGGAKSLPLAVTLRAKDYMAKPDWSGEVKFESFAAPALFDLSKRLGVNTPEGFAVEKGTLSGAVEFTRDAGVRGDVELAGGELRLPAGGKLAGGDLRFEVAGNAIDLRVHSAPGVENPAQQRVEGKYDFESKSLQVKLMAGKPTPIEETLKLIPGAPLLSQFRGGQWRGLVGYAEESGSARWSGQLDVSDAVADVEGLASPVKVSFLAALDGDKLAAKNVRGVCGKIAFTGDYRYESKLARPHRLNLSAAKLDFGQLEAELRPTLSRGGFLSKTLRIGRAPVPEWLAARKVEGTLRIASATAGGTKFEKVSAKFWWDGVKGSLSEVSASGEEGLGIEGEAAIDLAGNLPRYKSKGSLAGVALPGGGRAAFEGTLDTEGLGPALAAKAQSKGEVRAKGVRFNPEWLFDEVSGNYAMTGPGKLTLSDLTLTQGTDSYQGQASTMADGKLSLELTGGPRKQVKVLGSLFK